MPRNRVNLDASLPLEVTRQIDIFCDEFAASLSRGGGVGLEKYLDRVDPQGRNVLIDELIPLALDWLRKAGEADPRGVILAANPTLRDELLRVLADGEATVSTDYRPRSTHASSGLSIRCPHCHNMVELIVDASLMEIACSSCGGTFSLINGDEDTHDAATVTRVAHFELIERLGMGGFGTVWKARDTMLERTVALKIPRREHLDPMSVEKFMREARTAAQLRHPNIISTHEVGRQGNTFYIVTDYVRGVPLSVMIADHRLGIREAVLMVVELADALEHAHSAGVIHRDIKPSNVLIDDHGQPHLMDFGLAKRSENEIMMTTEGAILGTPAYMSPEQARGEAYRVDGRSDVYSLGVILFQLLTGELPFRGSTRMLLQRVINDDPPGPRTLDSRVPRDLDTICLKCLEKDSRRRYTASELGADLRRYLAGQPVVARPLGKFGRTLRWVRRNRAVSSLLAATMLTLLTAAVVSTYFGWRATDALYDSLSQEIGLTRELRQQGYGQTVRDLVDRAMNLPTTRVDKDELRRQLVLSMGDFVAYPPIVITPTQGETTSICLSNDGQQVFAGLNNGQILVYDSNTGNERGELKAFEGRVISAAAIAGSDELAAADENAVTRIWRRRNNTWEVERDLRLGEEAHAVIFSADGERAACLKDAQLEIWDVAAGAMLQSLPTKPDWNMQNGVFDWTREMFIAGFVNTNADTVGWALWKLGTGERTHQEEMPSLGWTYPNAIDLTKVGDRMAIGFDEALLSYAMLDFKETNLSSFDATAAVHFSPTNPYLVAANIRGRITVWHTASNRQLATLQLPTSTRSEIDLAFSADGGRLAALNADRIQIWDLTKADEKTVMTGHKGGIPCAAFHPSDPLLATGGKDDEVRFWNPFTGEQLGSRNVGEAVQTLAFSPDGRMLAVGCMGRADAPHLRLVDVNSSDMKVIYEAKLAMGEVYSLAWSKSRAGLYLAGCGEDGVALWKVSPSPPVRMETEFELARRRCLATIVNRELGFVIWAERNNCLKAWDIAAGGEVQLNAPDMNQGWHGLALLPDGESIIYVSKTGVAEIWNVKPPRRIGTVGKPGTFGAPQVALSPDGKWFAALTQDDTVSVWHMPTRKHVYTLRPETGAVWSLAWDPTSEHLAVGRSDGSLAVWHLPAIQKKLAQSGLEWRDED